MEKMKCHLPVRCPCKIQHHLLHVQLNWRDRCENDHETPIFEMVHEDEVHQSMEMLAVLRPVEKLLLLRI